MTAKLSKVIRRLAMVRSRAHAPNERERHGRRRRSFTASLLDRPTHLTSDRVGRLESSVAPSGTKSTAALAAAEEFVRSSRGDQGFRYGIPLADPAWTGIFFIVADWALGR